MRPRTLVLGASAAAFTVFGAAALTFANDPPAEGDVEEQVQPVDLSGTLRAVRDDDGDTDYVLDVADGSTVELSVGPPWFWGTQHPLAGLIDQSVTVTGVHDDGVPSENASENARGGGPSFDVFSVNQGEPLRADGKPPWAGGPAVVGESHPGYQGWVNAEERSGGRAGGPGSDEAEEEGGP